MPTSSKVIVEEVLRASADNLLWESIMGPPEENQEEAWMDTCIELDLDISKLGSC